MKSLTSKLKKGLPTSPSMRREWIEITSGNTRVPTFDESPSMRREWIEIKNQVLTGTKNESSPSMRREWIEMNSSAGIWAKYGVSLHAEGVD